MYHTRMIMTRPKFVDLSCLTTPIRYLTSLAIDSIDPTIVPSSSINLEFSLQFLEEKSSKSQLNNGYLVKSLKLFGAKWMSNSKD